MYVFVKLTPPLGANPGQILIISGGRGSESWRRAGGTGAENGAGAPVDGFW